MQAVNVLGFKLAVCTLLSITHAIIGAVLPASFCTCIDVQLAESVLLDVHRCIIKFKALCRVDEHTKQAGKWALVLEYAKVGVMSGRMLSFLPNVVHVCASCHPVQCIPHGLDLHSVVQLRAGGRQHNS